MVIRNYDDEEEQPSLTFDANRIIELVNPNTDPELVDHITFLITKLYNERYITLELSTKYKLDNLNMVKRRFV